MDKSDQTEPWSGGSYNQNNKLKGPKLCHRAKGNSRSGWLIPVGSSLRATPFMSQVVISY